MKIDLMKRGLTYSKHSADTQSNNITKTESAASSDRQKVSCLHPAGGERNDKGTRGKLNATGAGKEPGRKWPLQRRNTNAAT